MIINLLGIFWSSFIIAFSGALIPGPLLSYTITKSIHKGWVAGPLIIIGHSILEVFILIILVLGLSPFLNNNIVIGIISVSGMIILLFISLDMIITIFKKNIDLNKPSNSKFGNNLILSGILMSISNPFWFIWWITIGINYITLSMKYKIYGIIFFFIGHIFADFLWYSLVSFSIYKSKRFIDIVLYRMIMLICAIFIIFFSFWFGWNGILRLLNI